MQKVIGSKCFLKEREEYILNRETGDWIIKEIKGCKFIPK